MVAGKGAGRDTRLRKHGDNPQSCQDCDKGRSEEQHRIISRMGRGLCPGPCEIYNLHGRILLRICDVKRVILFQDCSALLQLEWCVLENWCLGELERRPKPATSVT
jgi:hypothetical protein